MSSPTSEQTGYGNQFSLLVQRRFAPFFWTQFLGAFTDNVFKLALTLLVTYQLQLSWLPASQAGLVIGALFILPYVLFSATSGQLADKWEKTRLMRLVKNMEIAIMVIAAWGFVSGHVPLLLACVLLMGLHSTLFGPVKYAYLPQHLSERELTGGNGMVEMGTFVAILLGQMLGSVLIDAPVVGPTHVAVASVAFAVLGRFAAQYVPTSPPNQPDLQINWNPITETWRNLKIASEGVAVFRSLLGISWMWFFGAVFLSSFPAFAKDVLNGGPQVATLLLAVFSVGIGVGSLLCEQLSRRHVEIGLVPIGAAGMSLFAIDLYLATTALPAHATPYGLREFLAHPAHWRVLVDLTLMALCAGLYSVPMYALIQIRSQPSHRARIIAANNVWNAIFMVASSVIAAALLAAGFTIPEVFLVVGLANAAVTCYIFLLVPEYLLRFAAYALTRLVYRFEVRNEERIPSQGAAILVCNHVSFVDAVLLMAASPRPIRFIMDHGIFSTPLLGTLFRMAKAIPIAPQKVNADVYEAAFVAARDVLKDGEMVCIFPEGGITRDGTLQPFKGGVMKLVEGMPDVPVIPMALGNLWGSFFSRVDGGKAMVRPLRRGILNRVTLDVDISIPAGSITPQELQDRVSALLVPRHF